MREEEEEPEEEEILACTSKCLHKPASTVYYPCPCYHQPSCLAGAFKGFAPKYFKLRYCCRKISFPPGGRRCRLCGEWAVGSQVQRLECNQSPVCPKRAPCMWWEEEEEGGGGDRGREGYGEMDRELLEKREQQQQICESTTVAPLSTKEEEEEEQRSAAAM